MPPVSRTFFQFLKIFRLFQKNILRLQSIFWNNHSIMMNHSALEHFTKTNHSLTYLDSMCRKLQNTKERPHGVCTVLLFTSLRKWHFAEIVLNRWLWTERQRIFNRAPLFELTQFDEILADSAPVDDWQRMLYFRAVLSLSLTLAQLDWVADLVPHEDKRTHSA